MCIINKNTNFSLFCHILLLSIQVFHNESGYCFIKNLKGPFSQFIVAYNKNSFIYETRSTNNRATNCSQTLTIQSLLKILPVCI